MRQAGTDGGPEADVEWAPSLVDVVAAEIRRHRNNRGLSAQRLSDRCTELGLPIPRSVLANLESGYRKTISVPELLVLAEALQVPPLLLVLPLGQADRVEILPGREVSTADAFAWLLGDQPLPGSEWPPGSAIAIATHKSHRRFLNEWTRWKERERQIRDGLVEGTDEEAEQLRRAASDTARHLHLIRTTMREQGVTPPRDVPVEIAALDGVDL